MKILRVKKFKPSQPRDESGRWTSGAGVAPSGASSEDFEVNPDKVSDYRGVGMLVDGVLHEGEKPTDNHALIAERLGFPNGAIPVFVKHDGSYDYLFEDDIPANEEKPPDPVDTLYDGHINPMITYEFTGTKGDTIPQTNAKVELLTKAEENGRLSSELMSTVESYTNDYLDGVTGEHFNNRYFSELVDEHEDDTEADTFITEMRMNDWLIMDRGEGNIQTSGYALADGRMLSMTYDGRSRSVDHREVSFPNSPSGTEGMVAIMNTGVMRFDYSSGAVSLRLPPTRAQASVIQQIAAHTTVYLDAEVAGEDGYSEARRASFEITSEYVVDEALDSVRAFYRGRDYEGIIVKTFDNTQPRDEDGKWTRGVGPVYHGTLADFQEFDLAKQFDLGHHFGTYSMARAVAHSYGRHLNRGRVIIAYLDLTNPIKLPDMGSWQMDEVVSEITANLPKLTKDNVDEPWAITQSKLVWELMELPTAFDKFNTHLERQREFWRLLAELGYDGIEYENNSGLEGSGTCYVLGDSSKIRVTNTNAKTFDPSQPRDEMGRWTAGGGGGSVPKLSGRESLAQHLTDMGFFYRGDNSFYFNNDGVTLEIRAHNEGSGWGKLWHLAFIYSARKNEGHGGRVLQQLIDGADKYDMPMDASVSPQGEDGLSADQLFDWYAKFGFVRQPTSYDPNEMSDDIRREPNAGAHTPASTNPEDRIHADYAEALAELKEGLDPEEIEDLYEEDFKREWVSDEAELYTYYPEVYTEAWGMFPSDVSGTTYHGTTLEGVEGILADGYMDTGRGTGIINTFTVGVFTTPNLDELGSYGDWNIEIDLTKLKEINPEITFILDGNTETNIRQRAALNALGVEDDGYESDDANYGVSSDTLVIEGRVPLEVLTIIDPDGERIDPKDFQRANYGDKSYNPSQQRIPKGQPNAGQWVKEFVSHLTNTIKDKLPNVIPPIVLPAVVGRSFPAKTIRDKEGNVIKEIPARKEKDTPRRVITPWDQIQRMLKAHQVKDDEIKWSNIQNAVELMGDKVTRSKLERFMREEGEVVFGEEQLGGTYNITAEEIQHIYALIKARDEAHYYEEVDDDSYVDEYMRTRGNEAFESGKILLGEGNYADAYIRFDESATLMEQSGYNAAPTDDVVSAVEELQGRRDDVVDAQYEQYTSYGGENYREVVLTLPPRATDYSVEVTSTVQLGTGYWRTEFKDDDYIDLAENRASSVESAEGINVYEKQRREAKEQAYTSTHFSDVPNYVAHMRLKDHVDQDEEEGIFIEEIQSDRHQAGRADGYRQPDASIARLDRVNADIATFNVAIEDKLRDIRLDNGLPLLLSDLVAEEQVTFDGYNKLIREDEEYNLLIRLKKDAVKEANQLTAITQGTIPDAPFRSSSEWGKAMFKLALRDAVAEGKDWVGVSNGKMHYDRWGTELIKWKAVNGGGHIPTWLVNTTKQVGGHAGDIDLEAMANEHNLNFEGGRVVSSENLLRKALEPIMENPEDAKGLAKKIWARMQTEPSGVSMPRKEGFESFYDDILVNSIDEYVRGLGGKVEDGKLQGKTVWYVLDGNGTRVSEAYPNAASARNAMLHRPLSLTGRAMLNTDPRYPKSIEEYSQYVDFHKVTITPELAAAVTQGQDRFKSITCKLYTKGVARSCKSFNKLQPRDERGRWTDEVEAEDAEYLTAVESGDIKKAQDMVDEAANAAGYDVKAYHGTSDKNKIEIFEERGGYATTMFSTYEVKRRGFFFSEDELHAETFGSKTIPVFLKTGKVANFATRDRTVDDLLINTKGWDEDEFNSLETWELFDDEYGDKFIKDLTALGYNSALIQEPAAAELREMGESRVVFNPSQIKSADPVTYDSEGKVIPLSERFDSKSNNINKSFNTNQPRDSRGRWASVDSAYLTAVEAGDMEEAQRMVDKAAQEAGYVSPEVYHGTNANAYTDGEFYVFNTHQERGAAFFSSLESLASSYGEQVYAVRLKLNNPLVVDAQGKGWSDLVDAKILSDISEAYITARNEKYKLDEELLNRIGLALGLTPDLSGNTEQPTIDRVGDLNGSRDDVDWLGKFARQYGYDGVIVRNVKDAPLATGYDNPTQDTYVVLHPNQIKSTNPVTRDNEGKLIPLSERFNPKSDSIYKAFDPSQPRDNRGRWTDGGANTPAPTFDGMFPNAKFTSSVLSLRLLTEGEMKTTWPLVSYRNYGHAPDAIAVLDDSGEILMNEGGIYAYDEALVTAEQYDNRTEVFISASISAVDNELISRLLDPKVKRLMLLDDSKRMLYSLEVTPEFEEWVEGWIDPDDAKNDWWSMYYNSSREDVNDDTDSVDHLQVVAKYTGLKYTEVDLTAPIKSEATSEEGYRWFETGARHQWAETIKANKLVNHALSDYYGFGYRDYSSMLRKGEKPMKWEEVRALDRNDDEYIATRATVAATGNYPLPPEGEGYEYHTGSLFRPTVRHKVVDQEKLDYTMDKIARLDEATRGRLAHTIEQDMVVTRAAYIKGMSPESLLASVGQVIEDKSYVSTFYGAAYNRLDNYVKGAKESSLYRTMTGAEQRSDEAWQRIWEEDKKDAVTARVHISLPKGSKVAPIESIRGLHHHEQLDEHYAKAAEDGEGTMYDRDLAGMRSEAEILLPRDAKFKVEEVRQVESFSPSSHSSLTEKIYDIYLTYLP